MNMIKSVVAQHLLEEKLLKTLTDGMVTPNYTEARKLITHLKMNNQNLEDFILSHKLEFPIVTEYEVKSLANSYAKIATQLKLAEAQALVSEAQH